MPNIPFPGTLPEKAIYVTRLATLPSWDQVMHTPGGALGVPVMLAICLIRKAVLHRGITCSVS